MTPTTVFAQAWSRHPATCVWLLLLLLFVLAVI